MAIQEITIATPPSQLFQGISTNYLDNLTYAEFLLGILKKMNEVIAQTNANTDFIETFERQYNILLAEFEALSQKVDGISEQVHDEVAEQLEAFETAVTNQIVEVKNYLVAYSDAGDQRLESEIQAIQLGQINVIDPTTGLISPIQTVINNIAGANSNPLTASEYDALELSATAYDAYEVSAFDYDFNGKALLV